MWDGDQEHDDDDDDAHANDQAGDHERDHDDVLFMAPVDTLEELAKECGAEEGGEGREEDWLVPLPSRKRKVGARKRRVRRRSGQLADSERGEHPCMNVTSICLKREAVIFTCGLVTGLFIYRMTNVKSKSKFDML